MKLFKDKLPEILITGVNRGLGKYFFTNLSSDYKVIGTTRKEYDNHFYLDMWKTHLFEKEVEKIFKSNSPTVLIQNIGVGGIGLPSDFSRDQLEDYFIVNCIGPLLFINEFLKQSVAKPKVIIISSEVTKKYYPYLGVYTAAKIALEKCLLDLRKVEKISISIIRPGPLQPSNELSPMKMEEGEVRNFSSYGGSDKLNLKWGSPQTVLTSILDIINSIKPKLYY